MTRTIVAKGPGLQVLVTLHPDGSVEVAERYHSGDVWGPPLQIISDEGEVPGAEAEPEVTSSSEGRDGGGPATRSGAG